MRMSKKELDKLAKIADEKIDYSEIPELDNDFWKNAKIIMPERKTSISFRIDNDILEFFKSQGRGYQTKMNAVLKSYVRSCKKLHRKSRLEKKYD